MDLWTSDPSTGRRGGRRTRIVAATLLAISVAPAAVAQTISFAGELNSSCTQIGGRGPAEPQESLSLGLPPVPAGNTILLVVARQLDGRSSTLQITDSNGGSYTRDGAAAIGGVRVELYSSWVTAPISGVASLNIVYTGGGNLCAKAVQVRGLAAFAPLDQSASMALGTTLPTDATLGPVSTTRPRELVVAVGADAAGTWSFLFDPSFTPLAPTCPGETGPGCISMQYKTIVTTSVQTRDVHLGAATSMAGILATYQDANVKGDFNDDGNTDLVFRDPVTGHAKFWLMNGTGRLGGEVAPAPQPDSSILIVGADDFDGDHQTDLVLSLASTGAVGFWKMSGTSITQAVALTGPLSMPLNSHVEATGDLNHDGHPDLLIRNDVSQDIEIWTLGEGGAPWYHRTGVLLPSPGRAVDSNWKVVSARDYTGDGAPDLLWYNLTTGKIVYWAMDANMVRITGAFATPPNAGANNWQVVAGGDYGLGDHGVAGSNDIVWRNATSGRLVVWHMDPATVSRTSGVFTTPDAPDDPLAFTVVGPR